MDIHGLLCHKQWRFRKNYSTESLLLHLTETWRNALDKGLKVGVLFVDFRKAFDTINHTILLEKLKAIGVSGDLLSWLDDYLSARKQFVQLPYLPVYNAHFFPLKSTFKFTMRTIHGFHCLAKKTKEDKSFVVIGA